MDPFTVSVAVVKVAANHIGNCSTFSPYNSAVIHRILTNKLYLKGVDMKKTSSKQEE